MFAAAEARSCEADFCGWNSNNLMPNTQVGHGARDFLRVEAPAMCWHRIDRALGRLGKPIPSAALLGQITQGWLGR